MGGGTKDDYTDAATSQKAITTKAARDVDAKNNPTLNMHDAKLYADNKFGTIFQLITGFFLALLIFGVILMIMNGYGGSVEIVGVAKCMVGGGAVGYLVSQGFYAHKLNQAYSNPQSASSDSHDSNETNASGRTNESDGDATRPLPADWREEARSSDGKKYYYNTTTNATQWERPPPAPASPPPVSSSRRRRGSRSRQNGAGGAGALSNNSSNSRSQNRQCDCKSDRKPRKGKTNCSCGNSMWIRNRWFRSNVRRRLATLERILAEKK